MTELVATPTAESKMTRHRKTYPLFVVTEDNLDTILQCTPCYLVWAEEVNAVLSDNIGIVEGVKGEVVRLYKFKDKYTEQGEYGTKFEPLMLDHYTSSAIAAVLKALKPENQKVLREKVAKCRAHFAITLDFVWSRIK